MTRKQAIYVAYLASIKWRARACRGELVDISYEKDIVAGHAYDLGRIAGLREAAKQVDCWCAGSDSIANNFGCITTRADKLERRLEGKK